MSHDPVTPRSGSQRTILDSIRSTPLTDADLAYLASRGMTVEATVHPFAGVPASLVDRYGGRVAILSLAPDGHPYDVVFRCVRCPGGCEGHKKYDRLPGLSGRIFNTRAFTLPAPSIDVTEGQLDARTLEQCGLAAVGVSGANAFKSHYRRLFDGYDQVRVWGDGDDAGREFAEKVACLVPRSRVMMVPEGMDVNSVYVEGGKAAIIGMLGE